MVFFSIQIIVLINDFIVATPINKMYAVLVRIMKKSQRMVSFIEADDLISLVNPTKFATKTLSLNKELISQAERGKIIDGI